MNDEQKAPETDKETFDRLLRKYISSPRSWPTDEQIIARLTRIAYPTDQGEPIRGAAGEPRDKES